MYFDIVCDKGLFGFRCGEKCGCCCDFQQCFYIDGVCLMGCDFGFEGDLCKICKLKYIIIVEIQILWGFFYDFFFCKEK